MAKISNYYFKKSIEKFGEEYIKELTRQLIQADKKATGQLIHSLDYTLVEAGNEIILNIIAAPYLINVDKGRKKGLKLIPGPALAKWAAIRGFTVDKKKGYKTMEDVGWAISRKIQKTGIKPTNVLEKTKDSLFKNKILMDKLVNGGLLDLNVLIETTFKNLNK